MRVLFNSNQLLRNIRQYSWFFINKNHVFDADADVFVVDTRLDCYDHAVAERFHAFPA